MSITITEALAEIKTIDKRIASKREYILTYIWRQEGIKDPLAKDGGSAEVIRREEQAIHDLGLRKIALRRGINWANEETVITIEGQAHTIGEWLTWRRDVAPEWFKTLEALRTRVKQARDEALKRGVGVYAKEGEASKPLDIIVNIDEAWLAKQLELHATIMGELDGQLSLKNATTTIRI